MNTITLYYKFISIPNPEVIRDWQRGLCESLGLNGRILISKEGINGTLGGKKTKIAKYVKAMNEHELFGGIDFKYGEGPDDVFPRLSVKVRDEVVTLAPDAEISINDTGTKLSPEEFHQFIQDPEVVVFDARNKYESAIGKFKGAITPEIDNFKDLPRKLDEYEELKDKKVVAYCTGGIRCEPLTALMKKKGFKQVYQLEGGVVRYGEKFGDEGHWEGKLFVFDNRMSVAFSDKSKDIGECIHCNDKTSQYLNCANKACNKLILVCEACAQATTCSETCSEILVSNK